MSEELYQAISRAITEGEDENAGRLVNEALAADLPPLDILQKGVVAGITRAGELWQANEYFLPDVIMAADAFKAAMTPLKPALQRGEGAHLGKTFVIGVVAGDVHDLGKNLVVALLTSAGFEVVDLGIDVPSERFIEAIRKHKPAVVGLGAYMTTTMLQMKAMIAELDSLGMRGECKVMVGGVPTSQEFADEVGADAWGKDALDAMRKALRLAGA
jgi:corrinoid protein of di/trimethylamine methyltransferase